MRILVFTKGTIIMHKGAVGKTRQQIIAQIIEGKDPSLRDWQTHVPIGNAAAKLNAWSKQGAEIMYLTSRRKPEEVAAIRAVLGENGFPEGQVLSRKAGERYADVAERAEPSIIVEDDCESIGGAEEMTYTYLTPEAKRKIKLIAVKEFGGIDHLPDKLAELQGL